jgi:hypothetical protein
MLLTQCEDWNKPLIERIKKSPDGQKTSNIQELVITRLPWPNTFHTGETEPVHSGNPDWPAGSWEEMGLEVGAILKTGEWQKLTEDEYGITGFDSQTPYEKEIISIYAKDDPEKYAEFPIIILDDEVEYNSVPLYQAAGGKIIPYPSKIAAGSNAIVTLHIYADNGYIIDGASLKITAEGGSVEYKYKAEEGVYTFIMPDSGVTLSAKFVSCEAKLESGGGVTYYEHLKDAVAAAQSGGAGGGGAITLLKNPIYLDETITITSGNNITLTSGQWTEQEIQRRDIDSGMSMIVVESGASLALGGASGSLIIDGADAETNARLVLVEGTFAMKNGVTLQGGKNGGVLVSGGTFTMSGGAISGNTAAAGGGVYIAGGGGFEMSGGKISGNTATAGGGVYIAGGGGFEMSDGAISGNTAEHGGGVYVVNGDGFEMSGGEINGNTATTGGGVVVVNGGGFEMSGGAISENTATTGGGGVVVDIDGTFEMSGGEISGNTAERGAGVYTFGNFTMSKAAFVSQNNAVYLADGCQITVTGTLAPNVDGGKIAKIEISAAIMGDSVSREILHRTDGAVTGDDIAKFTFDTAVGEIKAGGNGGWLIPAGFEAYSGKDEISAYKTLYAAVDGAESGNSVITLYKEMITLTDTVSINGKNITLTVPDSETSYTIRRAASGMTAALFAVESGASLTLGGAGGGLVIDGAKIANGEALISVAGTFMMKKGVTLTGGGSANSNTGGGVYVNSGGEFEMSGGDISGNNASYGGGVCVNGGGVFEMSGGAISGNTAERGGGVRVNGGGKFEMSGGAAISGNTASYGGGVHVNAAGVFTMNGGAINGNNAASGGSGVYVVTSGTFTNSGGEISGNNNSDVALYE